MITQNLNLNVRFLIMLFFGHSKFLLLCTKPASLVQTAWGNFLNFSSGLEETLMMRFITKEKKGSTIRFSDMISQSLNLSLFATYNLIKRPLPSKRHGENFLNFSSGLEEALVMRFITKEKYFLRFDFLI